MPRTTLDLDPLVLRELRRRGRRERKSMGQVASELLAAAFVHAERPDPAPFAWTTGDLGTPRVDLEDSEAVARVLDPSA